MDITALKAFRAVAESGSFSAASNSLFLTQPAISKRIAALERELQTSLFDRIGHRIILTETGKALLPKAKHILDEIEDSRRLVTNLSAQVSGLLRLATSHHIGLHRLPPVLREYSTRYPQVELDIRFMDSEEACTAVANGTLELAVVTLPDETTPPLVCLPVWNDPLHLAAGPEHPLAELRSITLKQLAGYPAILPESGTFTRQIIEQRFQAENLQLKIGMETNYLETIRMLVSVGLGWSVLPEILFDQELIRLPVKGFSLRRQLGIVHHRNKTLANAARAFIDCLTQFSARTGRARPGKTHNQ
jgi:DNA-binding transcriptional LysR family regulator